MMAEKAGLTETQAMYHIWDTIITNNFLGGQLNPGWMRSPAVRAMVMFQNTPFKILERRVTMAREAGSALQTARGLIKGQKLEDIWADLQGIRRLGAQADQDLKSSAIFDALSASHGLTGQPVVGQFVREAALVGAVLSGGAMGGVNLFPQTLHIPFLQVGKDDPTLAASPIVQAGYKTLEGVKAPPWTEGQDTTELSMIPRFFHHWWGKGGPVPLTAQKLMKVGNDDIPEVYKGSPVRYLFAIQSTKGE
jgi:hypothetical protein